MNGVDLIRIGISRDFGRRGECGISRHGLRQGNCSGNQRLGRHENVRRDVAIGRHNNIIRKRARPAGRIGDEFVGVGGKSCERKVARSIGQGVEVLAGIPDQLQRSAGDDVTVLLGRNLAADVCPGGQRQLNAGERLAVGDRY